MVFIWLSLIIVLLIIQINNHKKKLRAFLLEYTDNVILFDICSKYCSPLRVESSVKVKADGTTIRNRYTISYHVNKMPDAMIRAILEKMTVSDRQILQVLEFITIHKTPDSDIIFGTDDHKLKIYTDDGKGTLNLICLDGDDVSTYTYKKIPNRIGHKFADILFPEIKPEWNLVLEKRDANNKVINYHNRLQFPVSVSTTPLESGNGWIHWISCGPDGTATYYIRPSFWYDPVLYLI